jgi:2-hydroxy-3-oxopropionate reductase
MGGPMAFNLVEAGFDVVAFSRTERSRNAGRSRGLNVVDSLKDAALGADVIITMLPDSPDVLAVVEEIEPAIPANCLFIDCSTIDPGVSRSLAAQLEKLGVAAIDAPVSGGEAGAIGGTLSIMVGGTSESFNRAKPVLDVVGRTIVHVGEAGSGQVVKAANQLIVAGHLQLLAEALVFLEVHDVALGPALDVLGGGLAASTVLERKRSAMLSGDYSPGFRLALHDKDLGIAARSAREAGVALPLGTLASDFVRFLVARGDGDLDHSALYQLALELNGRSTGSGKDGKS